MGFNENELGKTLEDGEGQESLNCCSPWGHERVVHDLVTEKQHKWYNSTIGNTCPATRSGFGISMI